MATRFFFMHNRTRLFAAVGFAALASVLAAGCAAEEEVYAPPVVLERHVGADVRIPDIVDIMRETGNFEADGQRAGYRFIDVGAWDDTRLEDIPAVTAPFFVKDIPDPMREIGRDDPAPAFFIKDIPDYFRELGRYEGDEATAVETILVYDAEASFNELVAEAMGAAVPSIVPMPGDDHDAAAQLAEWYASLQSEPASRIRESE